MSFSTTELATLTDAEVLARSQAEPELFAILVRRYEAALLRRAKAVVFSPEDAEEVVQDAFTKMYLYADKYHAQEGATFSSWAYTILNRVAYTKYKMRSIERGRRAELEPEHYEALPDARAEFIDT
jgi:RNA polymerase sigma-70 factor, ECF subfamily